MVVTHSIVECPVPLRTIEIHARWQDWYRSCDITIAVMVILFVVIVVVFAACALWHWPCKIQPGGENTVIATRVLPSP